MRSLMRFWFYCLVMITPFVFTAINDELFEFNKMIFVYAVTIAIAATWAVWSVRARQVLWRNHFLLPFMVAFLASQALSTVFSIHPATSIIGYYSRFHGGFLSTLAYLTLMQAAISTLQPQDVRPLLRGALLSMIGVSLYAIPEHFGLSPSCIIITNEFNASCWVQDVQNRVFASFGQPNWLAAYIITLMPFAAWLIADNSEERSASENPSASWRIFLNAIIPWAAIFLGTLALIFTKSRSGAFGFGAGIVVFGLAAIVWWWRTNQFKSMKVFQPHGKLSAMIVATIAVPILIFGLGPWSGVSRFFESTGAETTSPPVQIGTQLETGGTDSGKIRLIVWEGALKVWQRYPLLGSGVETFAYSYYQDRPRSHNDISEWDFLYNKAHNEFLNFLATTGIVGLGTYLGLILGPAFLIARDAQKEKKLQLAAGAWLASSLGLAISNFFGFSTVMVGVLFFLLPGLWLIFTRDKSESEKGNASTEKVHELSDWETLNWGQWILIALIAVTTIWASMKVLQTWSNDALLAQSKAALAAGESERAYQSALQLTQSAPTEALFWEQRALTMSRLAVSLAAQDATIAGQLAVDADQSSQVMLNLNSRHVNLWKSRIRVLLFLSAMDEQYLQEIPRVIQQTMQLAPTDAKLAYNLALVYETMDDAEQAEIWYKKTFELRPGYEEARFGYAAFLRAEARLLDSQEQYQYIFDRNSNALNAQQAVEELEASISAQTSQK